MTKGRKVRITLICVFVPLAVLIISLSVKSWIKNALEPKPDRLGSWGQVDIEVERTSDWQQFVTDSSFQLGDPILKREADPELDLPDYYELGFGTYPVIDGSTVAVPMAIEFAWQHLKLADEEAERFVDFSTTHKAYENLIKKQSTGNGWLKERSIVMERTHPVDLIIATEPSEEELDMAADSGITLLKEPVCFDGFVFITHRKNPVESLTVQQIKDIYSGKITNWQEVGGEDSEIIPYQREENSGSQTAMKNLVMKDTPLMQPEEVMIYTMGGLIESVAEYKNRKSSIGYTYKYYIDTLYRDDNVKILSVDGTYPDEAGVKSGDYPFTTFYYGVIREEDQEHTGGKFLNWMLSEEGQKCIRQAGYIPVRD